MIRSRNAFALDRAFAAVILIVIMSWIMFKAVDLIQHLATPWNQQSNWITLQFKVESLKSFKSLTNSKI